MEAVCVSRSPEVLPVGLSIWWWVLPPSYHRVISWDFCFRMPPTCVRIHLYEELRVCSPRTQGS